MLAPYSEIARSKLSGGSGTFSALASRSGKSIPKSRWHRRAVASCAGSHVDTDRAGTASREPGRNVGRAATELDDIEAVDVAQRCGVSLRARRRRPT
jgi:hypothetical protein